MQYCSAYGAAILPCESTRSTESELPYSFVAEVPRRLSDLASCVSGQEWSRMGDIASDLTRDSADRGFPPISRLAFQLEMACRTDDDEAGILTALEQLDTALRRVRC